jgi:hypothetical protein
MEIQINAGGFVRSITVTTAYEGVRYVGKKMKGLRVIEQGAPVAIWRAYCDQLSLIYTEGDTEAVALERMRLAAINTYNTVSEDRQP